MSEPLLKITGLTACVNEKEILHDVDLTVNRGEIHVLMGPNGAGKSTMGHVLMGDPRYQITGGTILFNGQDVTHEPTDKRAKAGMFMSFQDPAEVPGLAVDQFLKTAVESRTGARVPYRVFRKDLQHAMEVLQMQPSYAQRGLNAGFSGGEKKKMETLQLMMLKPSLAILDETDSGLDVDAVRIVSAGINAYMQETGGAMLIITHSTRILDNLHVDYTHVLVEGRMMTTGDGTLVEKINQGGYEAFIR